MPLSLRAVLYFIVHVIVAILIFLILQWFFAFVAAALGIPIPGQIITLLALLVALLYFAGGWYYYGRRGTVVGP
jgi:putative effector of murein hydrolase LrgA (UPF0299 family)